MKTSSILQAKIGIDAISSDPFFLHCEFNNGKIHESHMFLGFPHHGDADRVLATQESRFLERNKNWYD